MNKIKNVILFIVIFIVVFIGCEKILIRKDGNYIKQLRINALKKNSIDLIMIGSSHGNNGFIPKIFDKELKLESYNMGKTGIRIEQIEFLLQEYIKRQSPKYLIIEAFSFAPMEEKDQKLLANWAFDGLSLSTNKILAINTLISKDKINHIFPILQYHERWKKLEIRDFKFKYNKDINKGFGTENIEVDSEKIGEWFSNDFSKLNEIREITDSQTKSLENILKICKEKKIKVILVTLPYKQQLGLDAKELVKINNYLNKKYPEVLNIDLNKMYLDLKPTYKEFKNEGHLNNIGAKKYSEFVAKYLKKYN